MQRILLQNTQFADILEISEKQLHHQLTRVLRARIGQEVVFFDGKNREDHTYTMIHIDKKSVSFKREQTTKKNSEIENDFVLYQAIPNKLSKLEYIVQKCSEVGFSKIVFFPSERTQKIVISGNKRGRLENIMKEAIEQSGRNSLCTLEFCDVIVDEIPE